MPDSANLENMMVTEETSANINAMHDCLLRSVSASLQEAMRTAQEVETKLEQEEEVCNETMKTLWEECKPCLKSTCVKYYSRTCSSGSGLVGRQVRPSHRHTHTHTRLLVYGLDYNPIHVLLFLFDILYYCYHKNSFPSRVFLLQSSLR